tara:strand:- start:500 stop:619 length:120 start_codon:yes stop_codon:yes gene_type:complete
MCTYKSKIERATIDLPNKEYFSKVLLCPKAIYFILKIKA